MKKGKIDGTVEILLPGIVDERIFNCEYPIQAISVTTLHTRNMSKLIHPEFQTY